MLISEREHREITVNILNKDYPDIALEIRDKIMSTLPSKQLYDLSRMEFIVDEFKKFFKVDFTNWLNEVGSHSVTEKRELLAASIAMVYCPARLFTLDHRVRNGVMAELCRLTRCSSGTMSPSLSNAVVAYKAYKGFRDQVNEFYHHLVQAGIFNNVK